MFPGQRGACRLQLIQSVLHGLINFWSSVFPLPKACLEALEKLCNSFFWSGAPNSARGAKVSWESVCTPKAAGGLGLRRLENMNQVFGLKLIWLLFAGTGSLWVAWIEKWILRGRIFWSTTDFRATGSWIWRRLTKLRDLARPHLACRVRSGTTALFQVPLLYFGMTLIDIAGVNGPRVTGIASLATVSQACSNGVWRISSR